MRAQHDSVKYFLAMLFSSLGLKPRVELRDLFTSAIAAQHRYTDGARRQLQIIVPDVAARFPIGADVTVSTERLYELKCLHFSHNTYKHGLRRKAAVEDRAKEVTRDHIAAATQADIKFNGVLQGRRGPVRERLDELGGITPLIFGALGEVSKSVQDLADILADIAARKYAWGTGMADLDAAKAAFKHRIVQDFSVVAGRARAELLICRAAMVAEPNEWRAQQGDPRSRWRRGVPEWCEQAYGDKTWERHGGRHGTRGGR